jgi:predicted CoA-binding protein
VADLVQEMLEQRVWAVVGSFRSEEKWAYRIYRKLKQRDHIVYAVNPGMKEVDGDPVYASLADLPEVPAVVNIVTPPPVTEELVKECARLGIPYVWMQPGAESEEAVRAAEDAGLKVLHHACVYALHA